MQAQGAGEVLDRLGDMRFRARCAAVRSDLRRRGAEAGAADAVAWTGILEALGYGGQRELMTAVGRAAPWAALQSRMAGLAGGERRRRALGILLQALERERIRLPLLLGPMRPANRPESRLKAAAALAARFASPGIVAGLELLVEGAAGGAPAPLVRALVVPGIAGRSRAIEILTNAVLPVFWAAGSEALAEAAFRSLPIPVRYGAVKHIHSALAGDVPLNARRQQGMLYLLKQYCTQGGCGRCPLS
jgi:hypothetical protein